MTIIDNHSMKEYKLGVKHVDVMDKNSMQYIFAFVKIINNSN